MKCATMLAMAAVWMLSCRGTLPGVPASERPPAEGEERPASSSLKGCKRDSDCLSGEKCHYYRFCAEEDFTKCPAPKGDLRCHRDCADAPCPKGESCREVPVAYGDEQTEARLCF